MTQRTNRPAAGHAGTRRAKRPWGTRFWPSGLLMLAGLALLGIKAASPEYLDADGVLHESFFLLPLAFSLAACGLILLLATALRRAFLSRKQQAVTPDKEKLV